MTTRKGLNHLGQSGATDGQAPLWNAAVHEWQPGDVGGGGGGAAGLPVIDVVADHGAVIDGTTDDTAAWQAALDAAGTAGGARIISSLAGVSVIAGALQDTSGANAQLLLPAVDAVDGENISIVIEGAFPPPATFSVVGTTPTPDNQLVFKSTLTTGSGGALLGGFGPTGTYNDFTNVDVTLRNVTFRMPSNPTHTALDLRNATCADLDGVIVDVGSYYVQGLTEPTTTTSYGIRLPKIDNGAHVRLGKVDVAGFYTGYEFNEHSFGEYVAAWGCKQAAVFTSAYHASTFTRFMAVHCTKGIVFTGGAHYVDVWQLDVEHATTGWWVTAADVDDASNYGHGLVRWHVVLAGTGVDSTFTINGGSNLQTSQVGAALGTTVYSARDRLVAAAGNTILTLGATPVANTPLVWVNNTIKWPGTDYTISGAVITFGSALAASDVVLVKYETLNASPAASALSSASIADNFNRADSTSSLGSTSTGGVAWSALAGTWGISSNTAYCSAAVGGGNNFAVIDAGRADCTVSVTVATAGAGLQCGLVLRMATNGSGYVLQGGNGSTTAVLYKGVSSSYTSLGATAGNVQFVAGDVISAVLSGSSITIKLNGTTIITATDSTYNSVTKHGIHSFGGPNAIRLDDFSVV